MGVNHVAVDVIIGALRRGTVRRLIFVDLVALVASAWWLTGLGAYLPRSPDQFEQLRFQLTIPLSLFLIFVAIPLGAGAIERERDSGVIQPMLAHPLGRGRYLLGKWVGLTALVSANAAVVLLLSSSVGLVIPGYVPRGVFAGVVYETAGIGVILALVLALAIAFGPFTGTTGTLLVATGAGYLHGSPNVSADLHAIAPFIFPLWRVWGGLTSAVAPPEASSLWLAAPTPLDLLGAAGWVALLLWGATLVFDRADL